jgi:serine/threonine protein kinase
MSRAIAQGATIPATLYPLSLNPILCYLIAMYLPDIPGLESFDTISQSSNTTTWRAYQRSLDRHVMVKALLPEAAVDPRQVEQFVSVFRAVSRIKADAFCQIYDVSSTQDVHYVVMEDVAGQILSDRIQTTQRGSVSQMLRYALDLADALDKAWTHDRLVHRNLKPTAIRITPAGTAKLTDFGMAALMTLDSETASFEEDTIIGTPNFIAPEQITRSRPVDCRADMYALGMILYFGLTGRLPFGDQLPDQVMHSQLKAHLPSLRENRPDTPLSVCALVERLLMKDPDNRYAAWGEVITDITRLLAGKPIRRSPLLGKGLSTLTSSKVASTSEDRAFLKSDHHDSHGGFARFMLWMFLGFWLAALGNYRLGDPAGLDQRMQNAFARLVPDTSSYTSSIPERAPANTHSETPISLPVAPQPVAPQPITPQPIAPQPITPQPIAPQPITPPPPIIRIPTTRSTDAPPDAAFHRALADAFKTGGIAAMQPLVTARLAAGHTHLDFKAMQADLAVIEPLDRLAVRALEQAIDTEMDLIYQRKNRRVVPKAVTQGEVIFYFADQKRHVTVKIAGIPDAEKIRLLGPRLARQQAASICFRLLEIGNRAEARVHAAAAGALAPVLTLLASDEPENVRL